MIINEKHYQAIWYDNIEKKVLIIDQRLLPFEFKVIELKSLEEAHWAITDMVVRGAPLIGITAAYGLYLATKNTNLTKEGLLSAANFLKSSRPTAVNLETIVNDMLEKLTVKSPSEWESYSFNLAKEVEAFEVENCSRIGDFGSPLIEAIYASKKETVNILTHCNAGWLACGDWGTATSPIYKAHQKGIPVHVWVDETRPRNQGARLTAWELEQAGVPYTVIPDNTGGHLMQHGKVDIAIVGSDRTTRNGDVANKIGTYLKALAAYDNNVPFYVALPSTTIDFEMMDGVKNIPIEERNGDEVREMQCMVEGKVKRAMLMPETTPVVNYGFDVTPARFVSGLITERGICNATEEDILNLFTEKR